MDIKEKALQLHNKFKGKIAVEPKIRVKTKDDLSLAYTPGVAFASMEIFEDKEKIYDYCWTGNTILIVTDGSAVLGLGDIGPEASLPVMEGKSLLFKEFGNVNCVPLCLNTKDPDEIVETVLRVMPAYGGVNLEDISAPRCFEIEEKLKKALGNKPVFHDDQHGTSIVVLAALINAAKVVGKNLREMRILINGAGSAGVATTKLLHNYGVGDIILSDTAGAIYEGREENMNPIKEEVSKITNRNMVRGPLEEIIKGVDVFIGVSRPGILTEEMVRSMAHRAIVFAMANPVPEIMPEEARRGGAEIIATGRSDFPNQVNNLLAFPGVFRGALDARVQVNEKMRVAAALAIASYVEKPEANMIVPSPLDKGVADRVAEAIRKSAKE
ncbi:MAG: NAD-dependent malic enzyme [Candidatus Colwellbacteria bacterium CG10_big_fil_rev_8_21_14_0_10_41_28]|uniref:NAD-dependent malic enzyme n=1 Tax=Candidatus Colwellbacteria bacterium CG10_big_fil_rev_8_21_14_0_10_41_28 TaxID=1974539 RepID=A0A2H0VHU8_9BACT|nr:MAG: NAD-dependent malic enzyme [Candidatus Colwellbacteria bacterium CG10_big_fil_rev_8_21_14_0_10_41_28]